MEALVRYRAWEWEMTFSFPLISLCVHLVATNQDTSLSEKARTSLELCYVKT